eukprot:363803-Chlamydomonas_euryale.AAC.6
MVSQTCKTSAKSLIDVFCMECSHLTLRLLPPVRILMYLGTRETFHKSLGTKCDYPETQDASTSEHAKVHSGANARLQHPYITLSPLHPWRKGGLHVAKLRAAAHNLPDLAKTDLALQLEAHLASPGIHGCNAGPTVSQGHACAHIAYIGMHACMCTALPLASCGTAAPRARLPPWPSPQPSHTAGQPPALAAPS